jgi:5-methylcytosine-specific restriction endonuclease McrA
MTYKSYCSNCGIVCFGSNLCETCRTELDANGELPNSKEIRRLRREAGLCSKCGVNERIEGGSWCRECKNEDERQRAAGKYYTNAETIGRRSFSLNSKAKKWGAMGVVTKQELIDLYEHTQNCPLCGASTVEPDQVEFDHNIALSKGGTNFIDNIGILCPRCNRSKNDMSINEFIEYCGWVARNTHT